MRAWIARLFPFLRDDDGPPEEIRRLDDAAEERAALLHQMEERLAAVESEFQRVRAEVAADGARREGRGQ